MQRRLISAITVGLLGVSLFAGVALGAHNGNNRAALAGTGDSDASGVAIVNYSEGQGTFNGNITVDDLVAGATYRFFVRAASGAEQLICSGMADPAGTFTCAEQKLALNGFARAVVRDASGAEAAAGLFARRGNCRDADQAGSLCEAQRP